MKAEATNSGAITLTSEAAWENTLIGQIAMGDDIYRGDSFILGEKSSSITLVAVVAEIAKTEPKPGPIIPQSPAVTVANFYNLLRKGSVPQELAEQLTRDYQIHLLASCKCREIDHA